MKNYKVEWSEYNKITTEWIDETDSEFVEADSPEEAIELMKQHIFDNADHEEYPEIQITDDGVEFKNFKYCVFTAKEVVLQKIPLIEYARQNEIDPGNARRRASKGQYKTAEKIGRDWFIDPNEPHTDSRVKSGKYINWRK